MKKVIFIYADGCSDCERMRKVLENYRGRVDILEAEADDERAVDLAISGGIEDLPGCSFGGNVFEGEKFSSKKLDEELKKYCE